MIEPEFPDNEAERQKAAERYNILDTLPEPNYDSITELMALIADAPVSMITVLDKNRNFLKSHHGVPFNESPREISFCGHAINSDDEITIIENATKDIRFFNNPLVTEHGVRFYAGVPLKTSDNYKLGTLCIFDMQPKSLTEKAKAALKTLAMQVEVLLELRLQNLQLVSMHKELKSRNEELDNFAGVVTHDLKTPLVNLMYSATELVEDHSGSLAERPMKCVQSMHNNAMSGLAYADALLNYYTSDSFLEEKAESLSVSDLRQDILNLVDTENSVLFSVDTESDIVVCQRAALMQILLNLVTNAVKYNDKEHIELALGIKANAFEYVFTLTDNGRGIPEDKIDTIFNLFSMAHKTETPAVAGSGVGLSTVKKLVSRLGGEVGVQSTVGIGSTFTFSLRKSSM